MSVQNKLKYLPKYKKLKTDSGFTLIELLLGSLIGVLVVSAAGYGLVNMLRNNQTSTAQIQERNDINRAVEFISDEIKRADTIEVDPSDNLAKVTVPSKGSGADAVLALNIPGIPGNTDNTPIVYFLSDPPDNDIWQGPKVIYRYGPPLDENGNFTDKAWGLEPLVDGISDKDVATNCDADWTATPTSPKGFYACVRPTADNADLAETAKLFVIGHLHDSGNSANNYQINNQVFARAETEELSGEDPDRTYTGACRFTSVGFICPAIDPDNPLNNDSDFDPPLLTYRIDNLGSALARNPGGDLWSMVISAYSYDDSTTPPETLLGTQTVSSFEAIDFEVETNLPVVFKVKPDVSSPSDSDFDPAIQNHEFVGSRDSNLFKLLDADKLAPALEKSYQKSDGSFQKTAKEVLNDNNLIDPMQPNKINLQDNQYVIAFEIGQVNQTDPTHPGIDYNDQLLLVTVSKSESNASN